MVTFGYFRLFGLCLIWENEVFTPLLSTHTAYIGKAPNARLCYPISNILSFPRGSLSRGVVMTHPKRLAFEAFTIYSVIIKSLVAMIKYLQLSRRSTWWLYHFVKDRASQS